MFALAEEGHRSLYRQVVACILSVGTFDEVSMFAAWRVLAAAPEPARLTPAAIDRADRLGDLPPHQGGIDPPDRRATGRRSLALTYLMQVYSALQRRYTMARRIDALTGHTGDAAELVAGLGPRGEFSVGYTSLSSTADEVGAISESHHFCPALF